MASEVLICNAALQLIKHSKRIESLTQGTREANACEVIYEELRDALLEMHVWNFACKRVQLARLVDTPAFEFDYLYQMPSDWIRLHWVSQNSDGRQRIIYKQEADTIATDATEVYLRYVYRVTDPNAMKPLFRMALSKLIGSRLAVALAQSSSRSQELFKEFEDVDLPRAKSADALQDYADQMPESEWITARYGGRQYYQPGEVDSP